MTIRRPASTALRRFNVWGGFGRPTHLQESFMRGKKDFQFKAEHKNPEGGLSAKGRAAYNRATGSNLKPPQPEGGSRKKSFCARSAGQMKMFPEAAKNPESRLRLARKKWAC